MLWTRTTTICLIETVSLQRRLSTLPSLADLDLNLSTRTSIQTMKTLANLMQSTGSSSVLLSAQNIAFRFPTFTILYLAASKYLGTHILRLSMFVLTIPTCRLSTLILSSIPSRLGLLHPKTLQ